MRKLVLLLFLFALPLSADSTVTLLHFSDYHSHASPFYSGVGADQGGIARAIHYLKGEKRRGALVFSGGDMINKGSPAWSDRYGCAEWPWLNGIVDAMAFGNHDADYGMEAFEKCRSSVRYPILSANTNGFPRSVVLTANGVRVGVFALAGSDFPRLVKIPGLTFGDPIAAARDVVRELRPRVDVVVMIGHEHSEDDYALARAVPGIDVIFGTHSHLKRELTRIPDTSTWFISPSQYLTYISRVEVTVNDGRVTNVRGALVPVDASLGEDGDVAGRVRSMQRELESDAQYRELFAPVATLHEPISVDALAERTLDTMRAVTKADVALSTSSSFRRPLPSGVLTMESLRAALPYDNEIVVCSMSGAQLQRVIEYNESRKDTDSFSHVRGADAVDPERTYVVATTDYLADVAFREVFACEKRKTGVRVRAELAKGLDRPDLILTNGRVFTGTAAWAEAVAIRGGRIAAVGSSSAVAATAGPITRVVDLGGKLVIPGINDAHVHAPWLGERTTAVRLPREEVTKEVLLDAIRAAAGDSGTMTIGASLPLHLVDAGLTRADLDAISTTRPIRLAVFGGHSAILNTPALRAWGIAEDAKDPAGGWYGRDEAGRLNGWLYEHAYWTPQRQRAQRATDDEVRSALREFEREALRYGITSVQTYPLISAARTEELLASLPPALRWRTIEFRFPPYASHARKTPVKYVLDGTPIERSAAMRAPYADASSVSGRTNYTAAEIEGMVRDATKGGQLHVHAVGDRAIAMVLDAMERTRADWPALRVRIEHGDGTTPDLAERMRRLGVIVVQNPSHFTIAELMAARYGKGVTQPARSLVAAGNRFALGSDGPLNPFLNMFFAATHPTNPSESLTVEQSLRAYTEGAAFAEFREGEKGRIAPGMLADLAVLSQDIFAVPPPELPKTQSVMTIVGGKVAWEAPAATATPSL